MIRISICLLLYLVLRALVRINTFVYDLTLMISCFSRSHGRSAVARLRRRLLRASKYDEYRSIARSLDKEEGHDIWKRTKASDIYDHRLLDSQIRELVAYRSSGDVRALVFTLQNIFHRKFAGLHNAALYQCTHTGTKYLVEEFLSRVVEQLFYITKEHFTGFNEHLKLRFFQRARKSYGKCALCLSGGGALAMYHVGVIRTLLFNGCLPDIINGTSGGSIIAGVLATRTEQELKEPGFVNESIANRYGVRWLPPLQDQIKHFLSHRVLMDYKVFQHTARVYYGDYTFEEAYRKTKRHVSITVTYAPKAIGAGVRSHALVLNHITTPHVLVWSAVTCSCALPGLMEPQTLYQRSFDGTTQPYYPKGTEWVDGSIHADIPCQRLTELFNAQVFIVSQVNPHVSPFLGTSAASNMIVSSSSSSTIEGHIPLAAKIEKLLSADIVHRLRRLAKLRVIPKIYGHDFKYVLDGTQRYTGDITICPHIAFRMTFKALSHPSEDDMVEYIRSGEQATFPLVPRIQNTMIIERTLDECSKVIARRIKQQQKQEYVQAIKAKLFQPAKYMTNKDIKGMITSSSNNTSGSSGSGNGNDKRSSGLIARTNNSSDEKNNLVRSTAPSSPEFTSTSVSASESPSSSIPASSSSSSSTNPPPSICPSPDPAPTNGNNMSAPSLSPLLLPLASSSNHDNNDETLSSSGPYPVRNNMSAASEHDVGPDTAEEDDDDGMASMSSSSDEAELMWELDNHSWSSPTHSPNRSLASPYSSIHESGPDLDSPTYPPARAVHRSISGQSPGTPPPRSLIL